MEGVVIGITESGERKHFSRCALDAYLDGAILPPKLRAALEECVKFLVYEAPEKVA